jgi:hypothetical protein
MGGVFVIGCGAAELDHLPAVAGGVAEAGVDGAVAVGGLLGELDAAGAHLFIGGAAVVDDQHQRRHGAFGDELAEGLSGGGVVDGGAGREEAELEGGLVGMLDGEPAVVAVADVGVDFESELVDVELKGLVLIEDVQAD